MKNFTAKSVLGYTAAGMILALSGCDGSSSSGMLDKHFNQTGIVTNDSAAEGKGFDSGNDVVIDGEGRVLVAGTSSTPFGDTDLALWRYNADGTPDTTFNGTGVVIDNNASGGNGDDTATEMVIDAKGRILVCGSSSNGSDRDMALWRFDENGSLDTTFNGKGYVTSDNAAGGHGKDAGFGIAVDGNGKIIVAGFSHNGNSFDMALWRYNADGTPDTTFNGTGMVVNDGAAGGSGLDRASAVIVDHNEKIVVVGRSDNGNNTDMTLWRYNSDGTLDTTLNGSGIVTDDSTAGGKGDDNGYDIAEDSMHRYVIVGDSYNGLNTAMAIWRYNEDGTRDTTFNSTGFVTNSSAAGTEGDASAAALAIDENQRIVVTGRFASTQNLDMGLWRYRSDGTPDTTFKGGSVLGDNAAGGNGHDGGRDLAIDDKGRIVVTGYSENEHNASAPVQEPNVRTNTMDMTLWRYLP